MTKQYEVIHKSGTEMTGPERRLLKELEEEIKTAQKVYIMAAGAALARIYELRLYRENFHSFHDYTSSVWGINRDYAYKLMAAFKVIENVSHGTHFYDDSGEKIIPANERQARYLTKLSPEEQVNVWELVVTHHQQTGERITGKLVAAIVKKFHQDRLLKEIEEANNQLGIEPLKNPGNTEVPSSGAGAEEEVVATGKRGKYTDNRNNREAKEFRAAATAFFRVLDDEVRGNWRTTSKQVVAKQLKGMLLVVESY